MKFKYQMPVRILFGENKLDEVATLIQGSRCMIVSDRSMAKIGSVQKVVAASGCVSPELFLDVEPNPSCATVNKAAQIARDKGIETVIGLGGGSPMDAAKGVAALIANEGLIQQYLHGEKVLAPHAIRLILIPTTAGTGSEITNVAVFIDQEKGVKKPLVSDALYGHTAVIDPLLTLSMPRSVTASTGFDALCHAVESYWATSSQPLSDFAAMGAVKLIMENLPRVLADGEDRIGRTNMAMASLAGGMAFSQTRTTILHAISYPLTNNFNVPHGTACALALVPFIRYNTAFCGEKLDVMARYAGYPDAGEFADAVLRLQKSAGLPTTLGEVGITAGQIDMVIQATMTAPIALLNPGPVNPVVLKQVFATMV